MKISGDSVEERQKVIRLITFGTIIVFIVAIIYHEGVDWIFGQSFFDGEWTLRDSQNLARSFARAFRNAWN